MLVNSEDTLLGGRVRLRQRAQGYRAAIDPVLLAAAAPVRAGQSVVDLGCGPGAAALCLLRRVEGCRVTGIELQSDLVALATENAVANGLEAQFSAIFGDVASLDREALGDVDHVISNPPYLPPGRAAADKLGDAATVETVPLADWLGVALALVREKGCLTVIHRADRLDEILAALRPRAGDIAVLPLWPRVGEAAQRVIVSARRGVRNPLRLLPGLVLHRADGSYTDAAEAVLRHGGALSLQAAQDDGER
jgi:tRNA1(Val) A37 N6-methylase TrmN6